MTSQGAASEIGSNTITFVQLRRERVFGCQVVTVTWKISLVANFIVLLKVLIK